MPLGLDLPYWIEDPDFDLDFHVRHHAVPPPGTPQQLSDVVSRIHARPLDRSRPLWELYVIDGVDDGRMAATFTKVHHATIDGASGAMMLAALLDLDPEGSTPEPVPWQPEAVPSDRQLLERTMLEYVKRPEKFIRLSVRAMRELSAATRNGGLRVMADVLAQPVPGPLGDFMRRRLRGTDNEVDHPPALAGDRRATHAVERLDRRPPPLRLHDGAARRRQERAPRRRLHVQRRRHGAVLGHAAPLPDEARLPARRAADRHGAGQRAHRSDEDTYQNRVSALFADLATNEPDPRRRIDRLKATMDRAKTDFRAIPAETLQDFTQFAPPAIAARAMRMYSRLRIADRTAPPFNLVISNVPGPSFPLYGAGAELLHFYPVSAIVDGIGLNITVQSYNGNLDFGFVCDRDLVPDVWLMTDLLQESMAELLTLT